MLQVIASFLVLIVTWIYVRETRKLVAETRNQVGISQEQRQREEEQHLGSGFSNVILLRQELIKLEIGINQILQDRGRRLRKDLSLLDTNVWDVVKFDIWEQVPPKLQDRIAMAYSFFSQYKALYSLKVDAGDQNNIEFSEKLKLLVQVFQEREEQLKPFHDQTLKYASN